MDLAAWRDLSVVWLAFLSFVLGIVPLVLLFFAVRGMLALNRTLPRYLKLGQYYSGIARDQTRKYSGLLAEPVTRAHREGNRVQAILYNLWPRTTDAEQKDNTP
jgi:hypothetical protein